MPKKRPSAIDADFMQQVGAIVLGGGRGTRLYPLTKVRAKPAVPLCGRYRLVDIPLSNCIHSGIKRISVLTQFNSHSLNRHISNTYRFDNFTPGYVEVLAAEQTDGVGDWFQGTADAVRKQLLHIRDLKAKYYLVLSGDQLYHMDYRELMATHIAKGADITVSALPVSRKDAPGFGVMKLRANGRIREFVEKPTDAAVLDTLVTPEKVFNDFGLSAEGKPYLASMGVYVFNADLLERLLIEHSEWIDFGKELLPYSLATQNVVAHPFSGFWEDIGTVRSYFDVSMAMTSPNPPFELHNPKYEIHTRHRALPGVRVENAQMRNVIVCGGSRIQRSKIEDSIVGIRSIVRPGAQIARSIILGNEFFETEDSSGASVPMGIGPNSKIKNAIIDHNARIGKNVVIRGSNRLKDRDADDYCVRDGIVIVFKNGVIPDGAVIG